MSEDICYIYIFAQIKITMCDIRQSICLLAIFVSVLFNLMLFSAVSQLTVPAGGLYYGSIMAGSGRSKKCYGYAF